MELLKPAWLAGSSAILTIDVQPGSLRFATGGNGMTIWLVAPLLSSALEYAPRSKEPLFCGKTHQGPVTSVRWSPAGGDVLASGGEDCAVIVWRLRGPAVASTLDIGSELWAPIYILKGHSLDITSLSWHPQGNFIATSSRDAKLLIWPIDLRAQVAPTCKMISNPLLSINDHRSCVDSAAWDPLGQLLASYSQDGELLIWKTTGFHASAAFTEDEDTGSRRRLTQGGGARAHEKPELTLVEEIKAPFDGARAISTLRMDWCPDGSVLAACNAKACGQYTAALLARTTPISVTDHVTGHRSAVSIARFFPSALQSSVPQTAPPVETVEAAEPTASSGDAARLSVHPKRRRGWDTGENNSECVSPEYCTALALASVDRRLTVWSSMKREAPAVELSGVFGGPITDLAWGCAVLPRHGDDDNTRSKTGSVGAAPFLLACSLDGSVAAVLFESAAELLASAASAAGVHAVAKNSPKRESVLGCTAQADIALAGICRTYGVDLFDEDVAVDGDWATGAVGYASGVAGSDLRDWLQAHRPWTGELVSRKLRRTWPPSAEIYTQTSRLPVLLERAANFDHHSEGGEAADPRTGGVLGNIADHTIAEGAADKTAHQQKKSAIMLKMLTQQIAPTAPEVNLSAAAVEQAQTEGVKRNKRRIAPVLVTALPDAVGPMTDAAGSGDIISGAGYNEQRWGHAWHAAPQTATGAQAAAMVAAMDLTRIRLHSWISSKTIRRRIAGRAAVADSR